MLTTLLQMLNNTLMWQQLRIVFLNDVRVKESDMLNYLLSVTNYSKIRHFSF